MNESVCDMLIKIDAISISCKEKSRGAYEDVYTVSLVNLYQWFLFPLNSRYAGERDKFGRIHGRGTVYFPNGRKFVGSFSHGARCGSGELFEREGARILSGTYVHDRLNGQCEISTNEGGAMEYTFMRGVASGPVRRFSPTGFLQGRY